MPYYLAIMFMLLSAGLAEAGFRVIRYALQGKLTGTMLDRGMIPGTGIVLVGMGFATIPIIFQSGIRWWCLALALVEAVVCIGLWMLHIFSSAPMGGLRGSLA